MDIRSEHVVERTPEVRRAPPVAHPEQLPIHIREELPFRFVHADFLSAVAWMTLSALLFFWLPLFNGFLAGSLGGWRARTVRRALPASLVAAVLSTGALSVGYYFFRLHPSYLFSGLGPGGWFLATLLGLVPAAWAAAAARFGNEEALLLPPRRGEV